MATKKAAATAKTAKVAKTEEPVLFTSMTILKPNWENIPSGTKVKGSIEGKDFESGRIFKEDGGIYICQSVVKGTSCSNKLGFKYAYYVGEGRAVDLSRYNTLLTKITFDPHYVVPINIKHIAGYKVKINQGSVQIGCKTIENAVIRKLAENLKD